VEEKKTAVTQNINLENLIAKPPNTVKVGGVGAKGVLGAFVKEFIINKIFI